ncbi:hypothetical protein [Acetobacter cibinongensis]|nr:hypothetical protein [Acetobacter cibinongensis]
MMEKHVQEFAFMKCLPALTLAAAMATVGTMMPVASQADTSPHSGPAQATASTQYPVPTFEGEWAIMAMDPVKVAGNRALGPAARLLVTLPDSLQKIVGQNHFSLSRQSGSSWQGKQDDLTVTFKLVSENSAELHISGKENHKLDLPLYRNN